MPLTVAGVVGTRGTEAARARATWGHWAGPPAATGTSHRAASPYQGTARLSQGWEPRRSPVTTAGRLARGATSAEPFTS